MTSTPTTPLIFVPCQPCYPEIPGTLSPPEIPIPTTIEGMVTIVKLEDPDKFLNLTESIYTTLPNTTTTTTTTTSTPTTTTLEVECDIGCNLLKF